MPRPRTEGAAYYTAPHFVGLAAGSPPFLSALISMARRRKNRQARFIYIYEAPLLAGGCRRAKRNERPRKETGEVKGDRGRKAGSPRWCFICNSFNTGATGRQRPAATDNGATSGFPCHLCRASSGSVVVLPPTRSLHCAARPTTQLAPQIQQARDPLTSPKVSPDDIDPAGAQKAAWWSLHRISHNAQSIGHQ